MKKLTAVAAGLLLLAMSAHAQQECAGGMTAAGNECTTAAIAFVPASRTPQKAWASETRDAARAAPQADARARKVVKVPALHQAALRRPASLSQDGQCAGTSDATGNAC
jgi:hypothetical protein